jgi:hypothetical protein
MRWSRKFGWVGTLAAGLTLALGACAAQAVAAPKLVAVGDLHGDYEAYKAILAEAGLIDARGKWSGGDATLVQVGDIPDRGPDTLKIIRDLMKLEKQAKKKKGRIVALIGNHEAMNVTGDLRYVSAGEYAAFRTRNSAKVRARYFDSRSREILAHYRAKDPTLTDEQARARFEADVPLGYLEHRAAWHPTGEIGKWVVAHDAVAKIGRSLFVHGGISDAYAQWTIEDMNNRVREMLAGAAPGGILEDEAGPLWYRGNAAESAVGEAEVDRALASFDVDRIVIGHTVSAQGIRALHGGKVIQIDTGISAAMGGIRSYLTIGDDGIVAHDAGAARVLPRGRAQ